MSQLRINAIGLKKGGRIPFELAERVAVPEIYGITNPDVNVSFSGEIVKQEDHFRLSGKLVAALSAPCARCLAEVPVRLNVNVSERFRDEETLPFQGDETAPEDEDMSVIGADGTIDLSNVAEMNLLLNIPLKVLCNDDCKGLCPVCGLNLNEGKCGCERFPADPRFQALRSLFQDKEV